MKSRFIKFEDLLTEPVVVDGIVLDATVTAYVREVRGGLDLDSVEIGDLYVVIGRHDLIKLDREHFRLNHASIFKRFENEVDLRALKAAIDADDCDWHVECDDEASA